MQGGDSESVLDAAMAIAELWQKQVNFGGPQEVVADKGAHNNGIVGTLAV
jgi:hypothetical protein